MTRQWLAAPEMLCTQHLLGEHLEAHIFIDKMKRGHSLKGFSDKSMFFGAEYVEYRHNLLARHIPNHRTPIAVPDHLPAMYPLVMPQEDDIRKSVSDLLGRCTKCNAKYAEYFHQFSDFGEGIG